MIADVNDAGADSSSLLIFAVTVQVNDFQLEWSRCNLLANYVGEYIAYQFTQRERAENLISTITNEFLESVVALAPSSSPLSLSCSQRADELRIEAGHQIRVEALTPYLEFLAALHPDESQAHYLELLTFETRPSEYFNQLGLSMLNHDFGVRITSRFNATDDSLQTELVASIEALTA